MKPFPFYFTISNCFTHSSLAYVSKGRLSKGIPISKSDKDFEVVLADESASYFVTRDEAKDLTKNNNAKWIGSKRLKRTADESKRSRWEVHGPRAIYCEVYGQRFGFGPKDGNLQLV